MIPIEYKTIQEQYLNTDELRTLKEIKDNQEYFKPIDSYTLSISEESF